MAHARGGQLDRLRRYNTPLLYPAKTLEEFAGNWQDKSGWSRHTGGVPRRATEKVAEAVNPYFGQFPDPAGTGAMLNGVISDIRVYGFTQAGRDMQALIKRKLIKYVSVEHGGDERMNPATRQMEASSLTFFGFAFVNKGACAACRINEEQQPSTTPAEDSGKPEETMEIKELEAQVSAQDTKIKELETALKAQKPVDVKVEIPKELSDLITSQGTTIKQDSKQPSRSWQPGRIRHRQPRLRSASLNRRSRLSPSTTRETAPCR